MYELVLKGIIWVCLKVESDKKISFEVQSMLKTCDLRLKKRTLRNEFRNHYVMQRHCNFDDD